MYGPQALDMISLDFLGVIKEQAQDRGCKTHMHVAQGERERIQIRGRYGKDSTTVSVLERNGLLDDNLVAAHIHDTTIEERFLMVKKGVQMVACPSSISMIDGIVPPIGHYVKLGGKASLGTDQAPGPGHHNMFQEMRMASILTKVITKDPTALPPWRSLRLSTIGGAEVLGLEKKIGSLEVGKQADVITVDLNRLNLIPVVDKPFKNFIPNLVYSSTGNEVDNVIINGVQIMSNNEFINNIDEASIINEANNRGQDIFEKAAEDWLKAGSEMVTFYKNGFL